jgi:hypothetical protein
MDALSRKARRFLSVPEVREAVFEVVQTRREVRVEIGDQRSTPTDPPAPPNRGTTDVTSITIRPSRG